MLNLLNVSPEISEKTRIPSNCATEIIIHREIKIGVDLMIYIKKLEIIFFIMPLLNVFLT